jgi:hypothetical protein
MINRNQWEQRNVTTKTTFLEASAGLAITLGAASADDLQLYLDKINTRVLEATTRGEIDILNKLYWKIWFALQDKRKEKAC